MSLVEFLEKDKVKIIAGMQTFGEGPAQLYKPRNIPNKENAVIQIMGMAGIQHEVWLSLQSEELIGLENVVTDSDWLDSLDKGIYQKLIEGENESSYKLTIKGKTVRIEYHESRTVPFSNQEYRSKMCDLIDEVISLLKSKKSYAPTEEVLTAQIVDDDASADYGALSVQPNTLAPKVKLTDSTDVKYQSPEALAAAITSGKRTIYKNMTSFMVGGQEATISIVESGKRQVRFRVGGKTIKPNFGYEPTPENQVKALAHVLKTKLDYNLKS